MHLRGAAGRRPLRPGGASAVQPGPRRRLRRARQGGARAGRGAAANGRPQERRVEAKAQLARLEGTARPDRRASTSSAPTGARPPTGCSPSSRTALRRRRSRPSRRRPAASPGRTQGPDLGDAPGRARRPHRLRLADPALHRSRGPLQVRAGARATCPSRASCASTCSRPSSPTRAIAAPSRCCSRGPASRPGAAGDRRDRPRHRPQGRQVRPPRRPGIATLIAGIARGAPATTRRASRAAARCFEDLYASLPQGARPMIARRPTAGMAPEQRVRPRRPRAARHSLRRGGARLGADRGAQLRRPGRPDRGHAPHPGRGEALDRRERGSCTRSTTACCCPGPEAQQLAVYIGWLLHQTAGGLVAGTLFVLPGFVAIMALELDLRRLRQRRHRPGAVLRPQGGGAGDRARGGGAHRPARAQEPRHGRRSPPRRSSRIFFLDVPFPLIILAAGADRLPRRARRLPGVPGRRRPRPGKGDGAGRRRLGARRGDAGARAARLAWSLRVAAVCLVLWLGPVLALLLTLGPGDIFSQIAVFFSQDGGGHLRRRLRGAGLRRAAGGRDLRLAAARRDAGRPRHGRDHARAADHGRPVRRLHGRLPRPGRRCRRCSPARSAGCSRPG